ncbi:carbonic anhydrase 9-like [Bicyclus anynana]|uniref:Carbonic anhydrase 9-like n=1 Tax=Bicyclus anynana TaxID=110368 RepID=A0A6J1NAD4_BICAN|nr:carbonic anhydrase 9-like [Bicyclus anynana]
MMYGKPKTVWILHFPTEYPNGHTTPWSRHAREFNVTQFEEAFRKKTKTTRQPHKELIKHWDWSYKDQYVWKKHFPACGGRSQSPVDLPAMGLIMTRGCRQLTFLNYDIMPKSMTLRNNGKWLVLYGKWECCHQPVVYGGAAHSRRYVFHSITLRWPSEHRIGGVMYPLESQVIHISAEHKTLEDAIKATPHDAQAILGIVNFYKFSNETQHGLEEILHVAKSSRDIDVSMPPMPLAFLNPPLKEYAGYQGSLTMPPCSENILWLVRARALPVTRKMMDIVYNRISEPALRGTFIRQPQPLNDRKVYYFQ